jgi:hypothetical protein
MRDIGTENIAGALGIKIIRKNSLLIVALDAIRSLMMVAFNS